MARPPKEGMDYFPHDTDASSDDKIEALEARYGLAGHAFYFKLLERIYHQANFEMDISDAETIQILARKWRITVKRFNEMLETAVKWNCFDPIAYRDRKILRSDGISKRASIVVEKRDLMKQRYLASKSPVSVAETREETMSETLQSKVKESKVNKSKVNNTTIPTPSPPEESSLSSQKEVTEENPYELYKKEIGEVTEFTNQTLRDFIEHFGPDEVVLAIKEAVKRDKKTLIYIQGVLENRHNGHKKGDIPDKFIKGKFGHAVVQNKEDLDRVLSLRKERNAPPIEDSS